MPFRNSTRFEFKPNSNPQIRQNFPAQDQSRATLDTINGNLVLAQLALNFTQQGQATDDVRTQRRIEYRESQGKRNKAGSAFWKTPISPAQIKDRQQKIKESLSESQKIESNKSAQEKDLEQQDRIFKSPSENLKEHIELCRLTRAEVDGVNFSNMNLRDVNLSNLVFKNSNFSGAKLPSMTSVTFDNSCNIEDSDWSDTVQNTVQFGSYLYKKNVEELVELIDQTQLLNKDISTFDYDEEIQRLRTDIGNKTYDEIQKSVIDYESKTSQKPQTLKVKNANFARVKFESFFAYDSDFSGSSFKEAVFRINRGGRDKDYNFYAPSAKSVNLTGAVLEFFDNQGKKIQQSQGANSLDIASIDPDQIGIIANGGIISKEYFEKMISGKEIIIKVNADTANIPKGLLFQSISNVTTSSQLNREKIEEIQQLAKKIGNESFGRYNMRFATSEELQDNSSDYTLHINLVDGIGAARADVANIFALGATEGFIAIDEAELKMDFKKILSHEIYHVLLSQHPMGNGELNAPSHISYLLPMSRRPDETMRLIANNIIPISEFTPVDHKLIEQYMKAFGREPKIEQDLVKELNLETRGVFSSYNPDANFDNIAEVSSDVFDQNYRIVVMNANDALTYCKTSSLYECDPFSGIDDAQAIIVMSQETGIVTSMIILAGENPKIKIGKTAPRDVKELLAEGGFSIFDMNQDGKIVLDKYGKIENSDAHDFLKSGSLDDEFHEEKAKTENHGDSSKVTKNSGLASKISDYLGISVALVATGFLTLLAARNRPSASVTKSNSEIPANTLAGHQDESHKDR